MDFRFLIVLVVLSLFANGIFNNTIPDSEQFCPKQYFGIEDWEIISTVQAAESEDSGMLSFDNSDPFDGIRARRLER